MKRYRIINFFFLLTLAVSHATLAKNNAEDIAAVSDFWAQGRYLAPDIACDPRAWDLAFVESASRLSAGTMTRSEATQALFSASPVFFRPVFQKPYSPTVVEKRLRVNKLTVANDVYFLQVNGALTAAESRILRSRGPRSTLVIDMRSSANEGIWDIVGRSSVFENERSIELLGLPTSLPSIQSLSYRGYPTEFGHSSGYFHSSLVDSVTDQEIAIARPSIQKRGSIVVLGNQFTVLPRSVMAARLAGQARFLSVDGRFSYGGLPIWETNSSDGPVAMLLGRFRGFSLTRALFPDAVIAEACAADLICIAHTVSSFTRVRSPSFEAKEQCRALPAPDPTFGHAGSYPPLEARLYAAAKLYHILRIFHPVPNVLGEHLRERYVNMLDEVASAKDDRSYALAIARFLAPTHDGHIDIASMSYFEAIGLGSLPVRTISTNDKVYIGCQHPGALGLKTGDEVLSVDGLETLGLLREIQRNVTDAPAAEIYSNASRYIFRGPVGSTVAVEVRGRDGSHRTLRLTRSAVEGSRCSFPWTPKSEIEFLWLRRDVAYLNLSAISPSRMEEIIPELRGAKHIIIDNRGSAQGGAWPLAEHIGVEPTLRVARFVTPMVLGREFSNHEYSEARGAVTRVQVIKSGLEPAIRAQLFILIDENTASQAEHSIHLLKASGNAVTVGSNTRGAAGDVTYIILPGNIRIAFSGLSVSDLHGHQTLGIGITPDYVVKTTVEEAVLGTDRALETALELIDRKQGN